MKIPRIIWTDEEEYLSVPTELDSFIKDYMYLEMTWSVIKLI